jgi:hypothetical protein
MPFPKTWTEELVLEWLPLKGYLTFSNVRLKSGSRGGVKEADIVGLRLHQKPSPEANTMIEALEILHIEIGSLTGNFERSLNYIKSKFTSERKEVIRRFALGAVELESVLGRLRLGCSRLSTSEIEYKPIFIASYVAKKHVKRLKEELRSYSIEFLTLEEVLKKIIQDIDEWKENQVKERLRTTKQITLPESLWLLNLIDYMRSRGFLTA